MSFLLIVTLIIVIITQCVLIRMRKSIHRNETSISVQSGVPVTHNESYALNKMASANELKDTHELVN